MYMYIYNDNSILFIASVLCFLSDMGIPLTDIIDFFKDPNVYHKVLSRFNSIEPYMRYFSVHKE